MILEGLSDISEAKQKLWYIEYTSKGTTDAKVICNSQSYNKYKKFAQGYKEIQKVEITSDSEKSFYTSKIRDDLESKYGVKDYTGDNKFDTYTKDGYVCTIVGKYKTDSYGYMVSDSKVDESVKMVEADVDAQYEIYKKTGEYPEETIVKATWELDIADDNHIFLTKNGKKKKFKIIPDNRGIKGYIGKPMKTGVKSVYYGADRFVKFIEKDLKASHNGSNTMVITLFNGIWDTCKEAK